jgi:hypothetical protein
MTMKEEFIPTYELVLYKRTMTGEPTSQKSNYVATSGKRLAGCFAQHRRQHRRKHPLPKRLRKPDA